jgi:hypothetical protein
MNGGNATKAYITVGYSENADDQGVSFSDFQFPGPGRHPEILPRSDAPSLSGPLPNAPGASLTIPSGAARGTQAAAGKCDGMGPARGPA